MCVCVCVCVCVCGVFSGDFPRASGRPPPLSGDFLTNVESATRTATAAADTAVELCRRSGRFSAAASASLGGLSCTERGVRALGLCGRVAGACATWCALARVCLLVCTFVGWGFELVISSDPDPRVI